MKGRAWGAFALAAVIALALVFTMNARSAETSRQQCAKPVSERVGGWACPDTTDLPAGE